MKHTRRLIAAAGVLLCGLTASSRAQSGHMTFNVAAGLTAPTGSFGDFNDAGFNLTAGIGMPQGTSPLGFRAEGMYNEFSHKSPDTDKSYVSGLLGSATYDFIAPPRNSGGLSFYGIGGIGYYYTRVVTGFPNQSDIGWHIGGGARFPLSGFSAYIEARYHSVSNVDIQVLPIVFGLMF